MNDLNLVFWAIDENMGTNLQAFYKHFYIGCLKTQKKKQLHFVKIKQFFFFFFFFYSGRARVNRAGRKPVRAGRSALRNRPSWNTDLVSVLSGDADGWRTVHHGRRSATHQGLARGANSDESDDSEKENWPSDGRPSGEARLTSDRPTSGSQPTGETTPTSDGKSSGELRLTAGGKPPGEMDLTSDSRPSGEVRQTSGGQPSDGKPPGEMDLTSDSQPSGEVRQTSGGQPSGGQLSGETYPTSDGQPSGEMDLTSDSQPSGDVRPMSDSPASGDAKLTSDSQSSGESRLTSDGQPDGPYPVATDTGGTYDLHNNSSDARDGDTEDEELATSLESVSHRATLHNHRNPRHNSVRSRQCSLLLAVRNRSFFTTKEQPR